MSTKKDHWNFKQTMRALRMIADSPPPKYGGFHLTTVKIAKEALYHIRRLQNKTAKAAKGKEQPNTADRHYICEIGRLFWGDDKQCYSGAAVYRKAKEVVLWKEIK